MKIHTNMFKGYFTNGIDCLPGTNMESRSLSNALLAVSMKKNISPADNLRCVMNHQHTVAVHELPTQKWRTEALYSRSVHKFDISRCIRQNAFDQMISFHGKWDTIPWKLQLNDEFTIQSNTSRGWEESRHHYHKYFPTSSQYQNRNQEQYNYRAGWKHPLDLPSVWTEKCAKSAPHLGLWVKSREFTLLRLCLPWWVLRGMKVS